MSEKTGIKQANISLENKEAIVSYSDEEVTAEQISGFVEEMGFISFVKEVNGKVLDEKTPTKNASAQLSAELSLPMNGGGDVKGLHDQIAKCLLHITVSIMHKSE